MARSLKNIALKTSGVTSVPGNQSWAADVPSNLLDAILASIEQDAYRIVELDEFNRPKTLFHAVQVGDKRTRRLPVGQWLMADQKNVTDGTSKSVYLSGFNVLLDLSEMKKYLTRFKRDRRLAIIPIKVSALRRKEHSRSPVWLAHWMMIPSDWTILATNSRKR